MGLVTENHETQVAFANPLEADLYRIYVSDQPLEQLNQIVTRRATHKLKKNQEVMLIQQIRTGGVQAETELIWHSLPTISSTIHGYRNKGISDSELFALGLSSAREVTQSFSENIKPASEFKKMVERKTNRKLTDALVSFYDIDDEDALLVFAYFDARKVFQKETGRSAKEDDLNILEEIIREDCPWLLPTGDDRRSYRSRSKNKQNLIHINNVFLAKNQESETDRIDEGGPQLHSEALELSEAVHKIMEEKLTDVERKALLLKYEMEVNLTNAARDMGVTLKKFGNIEKEAIRKIRNNLILQGLLVRRKTEAEARSLEEILGRGKKKKEAPPVIEVETDKVDQPQNKINKPIIENVASRPRLRKQDLLTSYMHDTQFSEYIRAVSQHEFKLLLNTKCPQIIELGEEWQDAFTLLRDRASRGQRQQIIAGSPSRVSPTILRPFSWSGLDPDRKGSSDYSDLLRHMMIRFNMTFLAGDIQPPQITEQFNILNVNLLDFTGREEAAIRPRQLYRFLSDPSRPVFTARAHKNFNFLVLRTKDTKNIKSGGISLEEFEQKWYGKYDYSLNNAASWIPKDGKEKMYYMTYDIAQEHGLALYWSQPGKPMIKR